MSDSSDVQQFANLHIEEVPEPTKQMISSRSAEWIKRRNEGNLPEYIKFFTAHAEFYDADGRTITGKPNILEYSTVQFEYGQERGGQPFILQSEDIYRDHENSLAYYDEGVYEWLNIESGRYITKWIWEGDNYYLEHVYFTIDDVIPPVPGMNGNIHNGH